MIELRHQKRYLKKIFIFATCMSILAVVLPQLAVAFVSAMAVKMVLEQVIPLLISIITGPVWNILDGALPLREKKGLLFPVLDGPADRPKPSWSFKEWHALFDWTVLLVPALACLIWAISHMVMTMQWALPSAMAFNVLFGPYGAFMFALTMFFYAYESYQAMRQAQNYAAKLKNAGCLGHDEYAGKDFYKESIQEVRRHQIDMVAWGFAALGALLFVVPSFAFVIHLAMPVVWAFTITALICYGVSSGIKAYQLRQPEPLILDEIGRGQTQASPIFDFGGGLNPPPFGSNRGQSLFQRLFGGSRDLDARDEAADCGYQGF